MQLLNDVEWTPDGLIVDGWRFHYQHGRVGDGQRNDEFSFYKLRPMLEEYQHFFEQRSVKVRTLLEVGMWDGRSLAFWIKTLQPDHAIGVDLSARIDSPYFSHFINEHALADRVDTHWEVNQADEKRMRAVLAGRDQDLDLVIDDASHPYGPTRSTFQTVFPLLQPGGLYVIEDWAWEHWPDFDGSRAQWANERAMADFVRQLVQLGACSDAVRAVSIYKNFVVVERGTGVLPVRFDVEKHITVRRSAPAERAARQALQLAVNRARRVLR